MTNRIALWLGLAILALFLADALVLGWGLPVIIGRLLIRLIDWMAFWR